MEQIGVCRQEGCKEMAMNYEILFARAQNQLSDAKISARGGIFDINQSVVLPRLADSLPNTNTPSRVSERFIKQISFHAEPTFLPILKVASHVSSCGPMNGAESVFAT